MSLNLGPSVEYEIVHNSSAVDLLIQLAYTSSSEQELPERMLPPLEMDIRVPVAGLSAWKSGDAETAFDALSRQEKNAGIAALINYLPAVTEVGGSCKYRYLFSFIFLFRCAIGLQEQV